MQLVLRQLGDGGQHLEGELAADDGGELGHFARARMAVEPRQQRAAQGGGDAEGGLFGDEGIVIASPARIRSEEHTSELQSLMRNSYAVFCLKKKISIT